MESTFGFGPVHTSMFMSAFARNGRADMWGLWWYCGIRSLCGFSLRRYFVFFRKGGLLYPHFSLLYAHTSGRSIVFVFAGAKAVVLGMGKLV